MQNSKLRKLLIIAGPTATGKTGLALDLARKFRGSLISCDSRQVYQYMDVVTGKDIPVNIKYQIANIKYGDSYLGFYDFEGVALWGYDLVRPDQQFNVSLYVEFVHDLLEELWNDGILPILVGGTGFYLQSLLDPPESLGVTVDEELRIRLSGLDAESLYELLMQKAPVKAAAMNDSDKKNPRRLIRALEVAEQAIVEPGKRMSGYTSLKETADCLLIGLSSQNRQFLYNRIDKRIEDRLLDDTLVDELEFLSENNYLAKAPSATLGYQQLIDWMGGLVSFGEMVQRWKYAEHGYARKQLTWFKKQSDLRWFDVARDGYEEEISELVESWMGKKDN